MNFSLQNLPQSEIEILVTLPFSEFEPHVKRAALSISEEIEIEGFRKGKVPFEMVRNRFGEAVIYERAAELAVKKTYPTILEELVAKGEVRTENPLIGRPEITVTKLAPGNELQYKVKVAVLPEVKLPDYKEIAGRVRREKKEISVSGEEILKTLDWIRESRATGEGEARKVPDLTDEFAKSLGSFSDVEALKKNVKDGLRLEKEEREKQRIRARILEEIAKNAAIEIPDALAEAEFAKMLGELKSGVEGMGMKWEDYLSHIKKTPEELRQDWIEDAANRARSALVLREIGKTENIRPSDEEVRQRADEFLRQYKTSEEAEKGLDPEKLKEYTMGVLRNEKVFAFLENIE